MSATIATTPYTSSASAMFDAGRQPLATLQFNTPEPKATVKVRKHTDVFFCPRAVNPWANLAQSPVKVNDVSKPLVPKRITDVFFSPDAVSLSADIIYTLNEVDVEDPDDDDDIPIAQLKEIALSSLNAVSSTLKRVPRVKKRFIPKDYRDPDEMALYSLTTGPSTLKRVPRVKKRVIPKDSSDLDEMALSSLTTSPSTLKRAPRVNKRVSPKDSSDPDEMVLSSLTTGPSTLKRVPRVKKRVSPKDSGDLHEMVLSSLTTGPSTLKRVPRVKKRVDPKDSGDPDDEDLPLSRVKELMVQLGCHPAPIQFIPGSPPPFKHTLITPATIPVRRIAANRRFGWHKGVSAASSH